MSVLETPADNLRNNNRRILVVGPRGTGKTTFSVSASEFAGRHMDGDLVDGKRVGRRRCEDVLVVQGDTEGILGAMDVGLIPGVVIDTTRCRQWSEYKERVNEGLRELAPRFADGSLKVVVVDLNHPAKLIEKHVESLLHQKANQVAQLGIKDYRMVATLGQELYNLFSHLLGVTVVGNAQIKASFFAMETTAAADAAAAKAIGGERSTFTVDLPKGIASPWLDNVSFMFARHLRFLKGQRDEDGEPKREYCITMQSSSRFEAKSRAQNRLPRNPLGVSTLRCILEQAYGKSI